MGRMDRVKAELAANVLKLSANVETSHKKGKIPSDYSLGFVNGLILFEHKLNLRPGTPKFFERTTSIGTLPIPVALRTNAEVESEFSGVLQIARRQEIRFLEEQLLTQARGVIDAMDAIQEFEENNPEATDPSPELIKSFTTALAAVRKGFHELDTTYTRHMEADHVAKTALQQEAAKSEPVSELPAQAESSGHETDGGSSPREISP